MRILNNDALQHILHLIAILEGKAADTTEDFSESDQAILMGLIDLKGYSLEWYEFKKPSKAGAYFPYYNLNNDLDLSIFGIYHKGDVINYADNCFILAAINSKLFTLEEIEHMRGLINTRYLPRDDLVYIAELFNACIAISYYNDKHSWRSVGFIIIITS